MSRKFFTKCFGCFCGHECGKTPRLPRKKKKQLKKFLLVTEPYRQRFFMDFVSSCDIAKSYKFYKKIFNSADIIIKFKKEIDFIREIMECENDVYIDDKGRLSWYWESDDDYGGTSGLMPFCYTKEEAFDTWAFSEVYSLVKRILDYPDDFVFPENIKNDTDLLKFIRTQLNNGLT